MQRDRRSARLGHVVSRRRKGDPAKLPIAADWPINVRPEGYYGDLWDEISEPDQTEDWLSQFWRCGKRALSPTSWSSSSASASPALAHLTVPQQPAAIS